MPLFGRGPELLDISKPLARLWETVFWKAAKNYGPLSLSKPFLGILKAKSDNELRNRKWEVYYTLVGSKDIG